MSRYEISRDLVTGLHVISLVVIRNDIPLSSPFELVTLVHRPLLFGISIRIHLQLGIAFLHLIVEKCTSRHPTAVSIPTRQPFLVRIPCWDSDDLSKVLRLAKPMNQNQPRTVACNRERQTPLSMHVLGSSDHRYVIKMKGILDAASPTP